MFRNATHIDAGRFRSDLDAVATRTRTRVADQRRARGLLDTSVVIDLETLSPSQLPVVVAISAITMAELAARPHAATEPDERARRQDRLQRAEAVFDPLPFDIEAARAHGRIYSAVVARRRKARGASSRSARRGHRLRSEPAALHPEPQRLRRTRRPRRNRRPPLKATPEQHRTSTQNGDRQRPTMRRRTGASARACVAPYYPAVAVVA